MKLTLSHYTSTITVEVDHDDLSITDVRDELLIPLLNGAGFSPENVHSLFFEEKLDEKYETT
jgi:hypothetical protein